MECTSQLKTEIYEKYHIKVFGYIFNRVNNKELAEDLCENVFLKIYEKLSLYDDSKASISTWIYTITRNTLTDYYRTRKVYEEIPEDLESSFSVEKDVCNREMLEKLADSLEKMDEKLRDIIVLKYYSGLSLKEIARKMGISYSLARIMHNNAISSLKNSLKNY